MHLRIPKACNASQLTTDRNASGSSTLSFLSMIYVRSESTGTWGAKHCILTEQQRDPGDVRNRAFQLTWNERVKQLGACRSYRQKRMSMVGGCIAMSTIHFMRLSDKRDRAMANTQIFRFILSALSLCDSVRSTTRLCRGALHAFSVFSVRLASRFDEITKHLL